ncbi:MAG: 16S rRNA (guanine(527)-N(7))-methyltransferase RsmG [Pseudomonadota bacterium]
MQQQLLAGANELGVSLCEADAERLCALIGLLQHWNRAYNLTSITDAHGILAKHLLDSLSAHRFVHGPRIVDVGTGGGFPGLPLALLNPAVQFCLLDSHAKKLRFVRQAASQLDLQNVTTVHARVQEFSDSEGFDTVICRAFASLQDIVDWSAHLLAPGGSIIAMKGHLDEEEWAALGDGWHTRIEPVVVPFVDATRHIVVLQPTQ